jgi:hypothetical protein
LAEIRERHKGEPGATVTDTGAKGSSQPGGLEDDLEAVEYDLRSISRVVDNLVTSANNYHDWHP